jgi:prepilin-type N-terminal cleavage/methylation domain-containing protein
MNKSSRGFTLIELLVVIAIIGILASIVLASLNSARKKGRDARRISDMKQVQLALELYYDANGSSYVVQGTAPAAIGGTPAASAMVTALGTLLAPTYIASIPTDPTGGTTYNYQYASLTDAALCAASPCSGYLLVSRLEAAANSSAYVGTVAGSATLCVVGTGPYPFCVRS